MSRHAPPKSAEVGIVIIGRNEGARLERCLCSAQRALDGERLARHIVYVDSGSCDDSVDRALAAGVDVVTLRPTRPFSAARGRNAGLAHLLRRHPKLAAVQFIDGDTELQPGWLAAARRALGARAEVAAVCGRRRERAPHASVWNRLCDLEWDTPLGDAVAFGGDVFVRVADVTAVGGYDETLIAGEDPDLALRIRARGRRLLRLDEEMTLHDAALTRPSQWWWRNVRAGHAYAEGAARHGARHGHWLREVRSNWAWGAVVPLAGSLLAVPTCGASLAAVAVGYGALFLNVQRHARRRWGVSDARLYAAATLAGKLPQALGQATYWWRRLRARPQTLIEYKAVDDGAARGWVVAAPSAALSWA